MEFSLSLISNFDLTSTASIPRLNIAPYDGVMQEPHDGEQQIWPRFLLLDAGSRMRLDGGTVYFCLDAVNAPIFLAENHGPVPRQIDLVVVKCRFLGQPGRPPLLLLMSPGWVTLPITRNPNPAFVGTRQNTVPFGLRSCLSAPGESYTGGAVNGEDYPGWGDTSEDWELARITVQLEALSDQLEHEEPNPTHHLSLINIEIDDFLFGDDSTTT
ncbi:hypothetical protein C8R44DRAFT_744969 [Mycena epipterygia]|nr:hypothetical protein C8R44DRAFT_744969 [Mycena epipterygia]